MFKKYIYMFFIFIVFILSTYFFSFNDFKIEQVKAVYDSSDLKCRYTISNIKESKDNYEILIYYPVTENDELNNAIMNKINSYVEKFKSELVESSNSLTIKFDSFENNIYTSFVFDVIINNNTAHNREYIFTLNFNNKESKVITIDDIISNNSDNLKNISNGIYKNIKEQDNLREYINDKLLKEYLDLNKEKYECFYFTQNAIVFYFNAGTILPKSAGIIYVPLYYDCINN